MNPELRHYLSLFPGASRDRPRFMALAEAVLRQAADLGTGIPDETFRRYLLAKLALWTWDGTNETVPDVLAAALPGCTQTDNGDGTVTVTGTGTLPAGSVFPVPAGIRIIHNS